MRFLISLVAFAAALALPFAASALPKVGGWTSTPKLSIHPASRLACAAALGRLELVSLGYTWEGGGSCVYMSPCKGLCPEDGVIIEVMTIADPVKSVSESRDRRAAQGATFADGPVLGASAFAGGELNPTKKLFGAWAYTAADIPVKITATYPSSAAAEVEGLVPALVDQLAQNAPSKDAARALAAKTPPITNKALVCPTSLSGGWLIASSSTYSGKEKAPETDPETYMSATFACTWGAEAGAWSAQSAHHDLNEWRLEAFGSNDKAAALESLKKIYAGPAFRPNTPTAKLGVERLGWIQFDPAPEADPASIIDVYVGWTRDGSTVIIRAQHYPETAAVVEAAVRAVLRAQP